MGHFSSMINKTTLLTTVKESSLIMHRNRGALLRYVFCYSSHMTYHFGKFGLLGIVGHFF